MSGDDPIVFVVDDDSRVREALTSLISSFGLHVQTFPSARAFLDAEKPDAPACLVLDLELPDINGLELQQELASTIGPPIVFITGHGDIPSSVRAMKAGPVGFLSKPFGEQELLKAIHQAIALDRAARQKRSEVAYHWPGNIRELQNVIERSVIRTKGGELHAPVAELVNKPGAIPGAHTLADAERAHIISVLRETNWMVGGPNGAAARLDVLRTTLIAKMRKLGIARDTGHQCGRRAESANQLVRGARVQGEEDSF
jgi:FixJ family two-component response regulator